MRRRCSLSSSSRVREALTRSSGVSFRSMKISRVPYHGERRESLGGGSLGRRWRSASFRIRAILEGERRAKHEEATRKQSVVAREELWSYTYCAVHVHVPDVGHVGGSDLCVCVLCVCVCVLRRHMERRCERTFEKAPPPIINTSVNKAADLAADATVSLRPVVGVSHELSGVTAAACQHLLQRSAQSATYARRSVHVAAASFLPRESPGRTLAGGLAWSREQDSRALCLVSQQPPFFTVG